ncbi:hypothetical protein COUCH_05780 [Couchioplanes caeruleus]|uniref:hypothetical protein n=1 Tax=Couchioplanes caeruleus TaxID=56438 RepID=UPI0020BFF7B3|nr:hypothetical protein [Couchioplanes caeruleus]UQU65825.1 hypothetical protein COUCH_05780 [Couchioplanes caeruleus]
MHAPRTGWWPLRLRRCRCGLPWPCQEAGLEAVREHYGRGDNTGAWTAKRDPGTNETGAPPTTRRHKHDNGGAR